jgi:hypothetical protein
MRIAKRNKVALAAQDLVKLRQGIEARAVGDRGHWTHANGGAVLAFGTGGNQALPYLHCEFGGLPTG